MSGSLTRPCWIPRGSLPQGYFSPQGSAVVASQFQYDSNSLTSLAAKIGKALPDEDLNITSAFCRVYTSLEGRASGLQLHADRSPYTWRVSYKAMDAPQTVLFRHAHTKQKFTILHLPGTFYAGHEKIMSDRFGNQWQHGVSPMDKERESVLSWVMDFGPQADILQNNGMFLEDFAESQLPKEEILGVHPVTLMGEQTHLRVMPRDDPSELNQHVQGNKWAISKFCNCRKKCSLSCLAQTQSCSIT